MKYETIVEKIADQTLTVDQLNSFIAEAIGGSLEERIRRHTRVGKKNRIDNKTGHSRVKPFDLAGRVHPKRQPIAKDNNGASKQAHKASTRTQRRRAKGNSVASEGKVDNLLSIMDERKMTIEELERSLTASKAEIKLDGKTPEGDNDGRAE